MLKVELLLLPTGKGVEVDLGVENTLCVKHVNLQRDARLPLDLCFGRIKQHARSGRVLQ